MDFEKEEFNGEYQYRTEDLLSTKKEDRQKRREEKKRIRHYKFSDKKHPASAIISFILGFVSVSLFITAIVLAAIACGEGGYEVGLWGFSSALAAAFGAVFSLVGLSKRDVKTSLAWSGLIINGAVFLIMVCMILIYI